MNSAHTLAANLSFLKRKTRPDCRWIVVSLAFSRKKQSLFRPDLVKKERFDARIHLAK